MLVDVDSASFLPPWQAVSHCSVFPFLNLVDLGELRELAVCRQTSSYHCAWSFFSSAPVTGETQSSTCSGPPAPGLTAPVWAARQLCPTGCVQLRRTVWLGLPALLPEAQPGARGHVGPLRLCKFLPWGCAAGRGAAGRTGPRRSCEDKGVQEDGEEIRRGGHPPPSLSACQGRTHRMQRGGGESEQRRRLTF